MIKGIWYIRLGGKCRRRTEIGNRRTEIGERKSENVNASPLALSCQYKNGDYKLSQHFLFLGLAHSSTLFNKSFKPKE